MLSNLLVQANTVHSSLLPGSPHYSLPAAIQNAGIDVIAGWEEPENSVDGITIANNDVNTPLIGIGIVGGSGFTQGPDDPSSPANNNVVAHAQIFCNQIDQAATLGIAPGSGIQGINVVAGFDTASGNQVLQVRVENNLIAGALSDAFFFANVGDGASGNSVSGSRVSVPVSCDPPTPPMPPKNGQCGRRPL
jgi:hypothetical protein